MSELVSKTVLVVDDEEGLRKAISFEFVRRGFRVLTAENGLLAQDILKNESVDVVISDIRMPGGDGVSLLKWIKLHQPQTPCVIFITAFADLTTEEAFDLGAEAIFAKPFDRKALRDSVERCLLPRAIRWTPKLENETALLNLSWDGGQADNESRIINLGKGGMFIQMNSSIPRIATLVKFKMDAKLPSPDSDKSLPFSLEGTGVVRWTRLKRVGHKPEGCGIEFLSFSDSCRERIIAWIDLQNKNSFIPTV